MSETLLPCPHCGGEAELLIYGGGSYIIDCSKCHSHSGFYRSEAEAAVGWNKRVSPWKESSKEPPPKDGRQLLGRNSPERSAWIFDWFEDDLSFYAAGTTIDEISYWRGEDGLRCEMPLW